MAANSDPDARRTRAVRGVLAASVATLTGLGCHLAAGGSVPVPELVLVTLVLSWLPGIALIGRVPSLWRQALVIVLAQAALHAVFTVEALASPSAPAVGMPGMPMPMATVATATMVDPAGWSMWAAHGVAAAATVVAWRSAETSFWSLLGLLGRIVARVLPLFALPRIAQPIALAAARDAWAPVLLRDLVRRAPRRGPPAPA